MPVTREVGVGALVVLFWAFFHTEIQARETEEQSTTRAQPKPWKKGITDRSIRGNLSDKTTIKRIFSWHQEADLSNNQEGS